jgi:hypothetical protein
MQTNGRERFAPGLPNFSRTLGAKLFLLSIAYFKRPITGFPRFQIRGEKKWLTTEMEAAAAQVDPTRV